MPHLLLFVPGLFLGCEGEAGDAGGEDAEQETGELADAGIDSGVCVGTLSGGIGLGGNIVCDAKNPCAGTAYVLVYDSNPLAKGAEPVATLEEAGVDLAASPTLPIEVPSVPCGQAVAAAFLDVNGDAGEPPRPGPGDLSMRRPEPGRMDRDGVEAFLILNARLAAEDPK